MKNKLFFSIVLINILMLAGCSGAEPSGVQQTEAAAAAKETLTLNGSVGALPLMLKLSEGFQSSAGGFQVDTAAAGRDASLAALATGEAELAMFEGSEADLSEEISGEAIAYEAVAVVVNPSCGVHELTSLQIAAIFAGESDDWADFGGKGKITIVVPKKDDSFRRIFEETFALRAPVNGIMKSLLPDSAVISDDTAKEVANTPGAIGICPLGSLAGMENAVAIDQITPSEERLEGGTYTPSRTIILAIGKNASKRAKDFYEYCLSDEAKSLAKSIGFIPVK